MSTYKPTILIDFDGVLSQYDGWKGPGVLGPPIEGARAAVAQLSKHYKLLVFTTRTKLEVEPWLREHGFTPFFQGITSIKVPAHLQIDDRSVQFSGWKEMMSTVKEFKPWWEKKEGDN